MELSNNLSEQMMRRNKDEPEERRQHRKREVGQAECVHVLGDRDLQDDEAKRGGLSEILVGTSSFCKGR